MESSKFMALKTRGWKQPHKKFVRAFLMPIYLLLLRQRFFLCIHTQPLRFQQKTKEKERAGVFFLYPPSPILFIIY